MIDMPVLFSRIPQIKLNSICLFVTISLMLFNDLSSFAQGKHQTFYCKERNLGRHFYCEKAKPISPPKSLSKNISIPNPMSELSAHDEIEDIRSQLQELRAEAVLRPTEESVRNYISFQREQLDRASLFSDVWRRVLWANPDLDYTLFRPVGHTSKRDWIDQRKAEQEKVLANLHKQFGLMYLYSSTCSACLQFSPILKDFATQFNIDVKAISTDGGENRYFPEAVINQGQIAKLGIRNIRVPAVLLFDSFTKSIQPISFGVISQSDLIERIFLLTQMEPGEDY